MLTLSNRLEKCDILNLYTKGCKNKNDFKIGVEIERLPINAKTCQAVSYKNGINKLLKIIHEKYNWDIISENDNIIGLKKKHDTITLEPGSQIEISAEPTKTIFDLKMKIDCINELLEPELDNLGIKLLEYGVSPLTTYKNINLIPKQRYHIMANYLWGILSDVMMRETAGVQCCIDFSSEEDAMRKFKLANKLSPFVTAMFANSPIRGGVDTGYKSFRALSWLNTDNDRCGFAGKISEKFSFEEYIDTVLKTPIIYLYKNNRYYHINGNITFAEFMNNENEELYPTIEDYELQANLYFPEVRLRNFIEIRNQDCVPNNLKYAILAIYKGIMYSETGLSDCEELLKDFQYKDYSELRYEVPKNAIYSRVKNYCVLDYCKEIINIAESSLKIMNTKEEMFLEAIKQYTLNGLTPADKILESWNGSCYNNIIELFEFT